MALVCLGQRFPSQMFLMAFCFFFSYFSTSSLTDLLVDLFGNKHNKGGHILLFHLRSVLVPFAPGHGVGWTAKFIAAAITGELR